MKTINESVTNELIVKNSKFITIVEPLNNIEDFDDIMTNIKSKYKNATHYCYAYIIGNKKHSSDDGEPSGTAGSPILNVLEKNKLTNILCVIVRYFGGIKLGAGGLIRAYGKSAANALKMSDIKTLINVYKIKFAFKYENIKEIETIINKAMVLRKDYSDLVTYEIIIKKEQKEMIDKLKLLADNILEIDGTFYI